MTARRTFLHRGLLCTGLLSPLKNLALAAAPEEAMLPPGLARQLAGIERRSGGRLGVMVLPTGGPDRPWGWNADARFPMCSSFKLLLAGMALHEVAGGRLSLDERLPFTRADLIDWSPVTEKEADHGAGMTVGALCAATLATSDNTAANLVLARLGGPAALTAHLRGLGDRVTRLDRNEPAMNRPGADPHWDTSSPRAMATTAQALMLGTALPAPEQARLLRWMGASVTGGRRLRAGAARDWQVITKTGTGNTESIDVGVLWPPGRPPLVVAAFIRDSRADGAVRDACLADVARLLQADRKSVV